MSMIPPDFEVHPDLAHLRDIGTGIAKFREVIDQLDPDAQIARLLAENFLNRAYIATDTHPMYGQPSLEEVGYQYISKPDRVDEFLVETGLGFRSDTFSVMRLQLAASASMYSLGEMTHTVLEIRPNVRMAEVLEKGWGSRVGYAATFEGIDDYMVDGTYMPDLAFHRLFSDIDVVRRASDDKLLARVESYALINSFIGDVLKDALVVLRKQVKPLSTPLNL